MWLQYHHHYSNLSTESQLSTHSLYLSLSVKSTLSLNPLVECYLVYYYLVYYYLVCGRGESGGGSSSTCINGRMEKLETENGRRKMGVVSHSRARKLNPRP